MLSGGSRFPGPANLIECGGFTSRGWIAWVLDVSVARARDHDDVVPTFRQARTAAKVEPRPHYRYCLGDLGRLDLLKPRCGPGKRAGHRSDTRSTREADLYFASFTLPDFLNYLLAAGALSIVFIPMFLEYFERGDPDGGWRAFSVIANFLLVVGSAAIALLMVFARPLAGVVVPGFTDPPEVDTLVRLIRIILPAQIFHVIGGLLSATLQARDLHLLPAAAPLVYSAFGNRS
jgi:hypothetical protein